MNIIEDATHPRPENGTWVVKEGRHVRVIEVDGSPIGEFVWFNANKFDERFSQARAKVAQRTFLSTRGNHLYPPGTTGERPAPGVAQILARQR